MKLAFIHKNGLDTFLNKIVEYFSCHFDVRRIAVTRPHEIVEALKWADICWFEWCDDILVYATNLEIAEETILICRLHSYEAFTSHIRKVRWDRVDHTVFVAPHIRDIVLSRMPEIDSAKTSIIPNGVNCGNIKQKNMEKGYDIAYLGYVNYKKGPMLLLHAFSELVRNDDRYRLHIGGTFQDFRYELYFNQMIKELNLKDNLFLHGWIEDVGAWLADKNYIVNSSVLEGHPVGILEGMAFGLKPLIHNFVGARRLYPGKYIWNTIPEFIEKVTEPAYEPAEYRKFVKDNCSLKKQMNSLDELMASLAVKGDGGKSIEPVNSLDDDIKRGEDLFGKGRLDEAEEVFQEIVERGLRYKEVYNNLGVIDYERENLESAKKRFTEALNIDPFYRDGLINLAMTLDSLGRLQDAVPSLERYIDEHPGDEEIEALFGKAVSTGAEDCAARLSESFKKKTLKRDDGNGGVIRNTHGPTDSFSRAICWINNNVVPDEGIIVSSQKRISYPEVSGYFIPTLNRIGEKDIARRFAMWLTRVQLPGGSIPGPSDTKSYAFDTGQVLRGWVACLHDSPELEEPIRRACDWLIANSTSEGRLPVPAAATWSLGGRGSIPEGIHIYVLPPLMEAGHILGEKRYRNFAEKSLSYYKESNDLVTFERPNALTHFFAYMQEALFDLEETGLAKKGMSNVERYQRENGSVPAYSNVSWVCSTGLAQLALVWYKLGEIQRADSAMDFLASLQNSSGGFYGSYGIGANYFPSEEISWAVKYYIDACQKKITSHFDRTARSYDMKIEESEGRAQTLLRNLGNCNRKKILDAGCGNGRYAEFLLRKYPRATITGLDVSKELLGSVPQGICRVNDSILDMPFEDGAFDIVYCIEALEHVVNTDKAVDELIRVLAPGGTLLIIDKNREKLGIRKIPSWEKWFDKDEIMEMMRSKSIDARAEFIPYGNVKKPDGWFICWSGTKNG